MTELEHLVRLIDSGVEYPEAEWRVSEEHQLTDEDVVYLREQYDRIS